MLVSKTEFVNIINRLQNYNKLQDKINNLFENFIDNTERDFANAGSICIGHESAVVKLLETMFETDLISWWIYETNYGTEFTLGSFTDNGQDIDLSTAEKLYDYLLIEIAKSNEEIL